MSKIPLYLDEELIDEGFAQAFKSRNVDDLTVGDVGMLHRSDEDQLDWAKKMVELFLVSILETFTDCTLLSLGKACLMGELS